MANVHSGLPKSVAEPMSPDAEVPVAPSASVCVRLDCQIACVPHLEGWERLAVGEWEGIRVGGTLYLFGYFREVLA